MDFTFHTSDDRGIDTVTGPTMEMVVDRRGAELIGLTWMPGTRDERGLLWRNGSTGPFGRFWKGHAPILFPIVGGLHENRSRTTSGDLVHFPGNHGFARHSEMGLVNAGPSGDGFRLSYRMDADDLTRDMYPWEFSLIVEYLLFGDRIEQRLIVTSRDNRPMPYQSGWHPAFKAPFSAGEKKNCILNLPRGRLIRVLNDRDCRLTGETEALESTGEPFPFTEQGLDRTYMFDVSGVTPKDRVVGFMDPDGRIGVRVRFADYPHLGIWSNANAPFLCVEPWQGMDDSVEQEPFEHKFGMAVLEPGEEDRRTAVIDVVVRD